MAQVWYTTSVSFFSRSTKTRLGIDIGTASIKIVELTKDSNRFSLTNYGLFELEPGDEKLLKLSNADVVQGIKEVLAKTKIKTREVIASIPSFPTFATTITMPFLSEADVAKAIPFEARKYIPIPLSEVQLDWAIVNAPKDAIEHLLWGCVDVLVLGPYLVRRRRIHR